MTIRHSSTQKFLTGAIAAFALAAPAQIVPLSEVHFNANLGRLYNQHNDFLRERYFVESEIALDFNLITFFDRVSLASEFYVLSSMGQTKDDVVFDPMDAGYGFDPLVRATFNRVTAEFGLKHHCYHEIDRRDFTTVYYNKLFLGAASPNYHPLIQVNNVAQGLGVPALNRLAWRARYGVFLRGFFGLARSTSVSYHNNYLHELETGLRYIVARHGPLFISVREEFTGGYWDDYLREHMDGPQWYYKSTTALEPGLLWARQGGVLSLSYTRDHLPRFYNHVDGEYQPRFSHDRIWKLAAQLFM